jgi:hypothetical protein
MQTDLGTSRQYLSAITGATRNVVSPTELLQLSELIGRGFGNTLQFRNAWLAVGGVCLLDAVWSETIGFTLSGCAPFLLLMCMLLGTTAILRWRGGNPTLGVATEVVALWLAFASSGNILSYLSATVALPLQDELLASVDNALGFQWLALFKWVWHQPGVGCLLATCYHSLMLEIIALGVWLSWQRHEQRIREFFWVVYLASLLTGIIATTLPAAGAFLHYGVPDRADWLHDLDALRDGSNLHFVLPDMVGIDTFPSFHTTLALLVIYIARGTGAIGRLFMAWNAMMLFSIPPFGGHYLVDMIGGGVVLAVSIGIFRCAVRVNRRRDISVV